MTNSVFRALIIGSQDLIDDTLRSFTGYREMIVDDSCAFMDQEETNSTDPLVFGNACEDELVSAQTYLNWLEELVTTGGTHEDESTGGSTYDRGYARLRQTLLDTGCSFGGGRRPEAADKNICLSLLDTSADGILSTKTREINVLSNIVARAVLYGGSDEQSRVAEILEGKIPDFCERWCESNMRAQEGLFLHALVLFLRDGLSSAEAAITPISEVYLPVIHYVFTCRPLCIYLSLTMCSHITHFMLN